MPILTKSCGLIFQDFFYCPIAKMCNSHMFSFRYPSWIGALAFKCVVSMPTVAIPEKPDDLSMTTEPAHFLGLVMLLT